MDDYVKFMENTTLYRSRVTDLSLHSHDAASYLLDLFGKGYFDMAWIDGGHDYETVKGDILSYSPLLKKGGLLSGHDYSKGHPGVRQAVDELLPNFNRGQGSIWWVTV